MVDNREHFNTYSAYYQDCCKHWSEIYPRIAQKIEPFITGNVVLDIGNGGVFCYNTAYPKHIIACDIACKALLTIDAPCSKVVGDALQLGFVKRETVDVIVMSLILHHLADQRASQSIQNIQNVLSHALSLVKQNGYVIIVEPILPGFLYSIEKRSFNFLSKMFHFFNIPYIYFFSRKELLGLVGEHSDGLNIEITKLALPWTKLSNPFGATVRNFMSIPAVLFPTRFYLFIIHKLVP